MHVVPPLVLTTHSKLEEHVSQMKEKLCFHERKQFRLESDGLEQDFDE